MTKNRPDHAEADVAQTAVKGPRLVKAADVVARQVVKTAPRPQPQSAPRPLRMPRGATEARQIFDTLFGEQRKAS